MIKALADADACSASFFLRVLTSLALLGQDGQEDLTADLDSACG